MNRQNLRYILLGGKKPGKIFDEAQGAPIYFKNHALYSLLAAVTLYLLTPLLMLPSRVGVIPYEFGDFAGLSRWHQYGRLLLYSFAIVVKKVSELELFELPPIPTPKGWAWTLFVFVALTVMLAASISLGVYGLYAIRKNYLLLREE